MGWKAKRKPSDAAKGLSDNFFSMLPGEEKAVTFEKKHKEFSAIAYTIMS